MENLGTLGYLGQDLRGKTIGIVDWAHRYGLPSLSVAGTCKDYHDAQRMEQNEQTMRLS
jgi:hypothetical protein